MIRKTQIRTEMIRRNKARIVRESIRRARHRRLMKEATVALYPYEDLAAGIEEFFNEFPVLLKGLKSDLKKPLGLIQSEDPSELEGEIDLKKLQDVKKALGDALKSLGRASYDAYNITK